MENSKQTNIACRVFKEQFKLIDQLAEQERPIVLYLAMKRGLNQIENQFEYQNDNQIENQNENAYVSVSDSESSYLNHISDIGKCILELLSKNIIWKEFSNNYGGKREKAGKKKKEKKAVVKQPVVKQVNKNFGSSKLVLLTDEQYDELKQKYSNIDDAIEELDTWLGKNSKSAQEARGKNHYGYFKSNSWVWENLPTNETPTLDQEKAKQEQEQWERAELLHQQATALYDKLRGMNMKVIFIDEFRHTLGALLDKYRQKYNENATYDDMANDIGLDKLKTLIEQGVK